MKCELCKCTLEEMFLNKVKGTVIKDDKGKQHWVCFDCQKKFKNDKKEMLKSL